MRPLFEHVLPKLSSLRLENIGKDDPNALVWERNDDARRKPRAVDADGGGEDWHQSTSRGEEEKERPLLLLLLLLLLALIERPLLLHAAPLWTREAIEAIDK